MEASQVVDKMVDVETATIAISETTSDEVWLYGCTALGFQTPAAITGTSVKFVGSIDKGVSFAEVTDEFGVAVEYVVAASKSYKMDANTFAPYDAIKAVMATQAAERLILIKPFAM